MPTKRLIPLLVVLCASASAGCVALAVGGAAAGGYVVGKDERKVGQIVDDGSITAGIKSRLISDRYVKAFDVNVDTHNGEVTLSGVVGSYVARDQAEKIARNTKGVKDVINKLQVERPSQ